MPFEGCFQPKAFYDSLFPGCQICVYVCISDFLMPSLYTSAFQEWIKHYKYLGSSFSVCLHICACAWALAVCSRILLCQLRERLQACIYQTVPLSSLAEKAEICWDLSWVTGWWLRFRIRASCLSLKYLDQSSLPKRVVDQSYLETSRQVCRDHRLSGVSLDAVTMSCCSCLGT